METYKSAIFMNMYECRNTDGRLIGIGSSKIKAEDDSETYNKETLESNNMRDMLDTWELNFCE